MEKYFDIVIVGGGIAGALLAYKLSDGKKSVLLLEAGADRSHERYDMSLAYAESLTKGTRSPYDKNPDAYLYSPESTDDYYTYDQHSPQKFRANYLKMGGGATFHWLGNVPRYLPNDFQMYSKYGIAVDWPISYADLEPYYCEAEAEIGVSGNHEAWNHLYGAYRTQPFVMPEIWPSYSDQLIQRGLDGLVIDDKKVEVRVTPQARNSQTYQGRPACSGNSSCIPICPIQAKYDASVHLHLASKAGANIQYQSVVFKLEKNAFDTIEKVHYRNWNQEEFVVKAGYVILAANAIETSLLLQVSTIANSSDCVGRYLMDHPQGYGVGISNEPVFPFRGPPTISGIDVFRDGDFRSDHGAFRISIGNDGWGRWKGENKLDKVIHDLTQQGNVHLGAKLKNAVFNEITRLFRFSYSTEMLPLRDNRVSISDALDPITQLPRPKIYFNINDDNGYNQRAFGYASRVLEQMFLRLGVKPSSFQIITDNKEFSTAFHIMGTTRMGNDPSDSVVNSQCCSHDHKNLYIIGAGVFPTGGTANPTLTIAALTLRLAAYLKTII